MLKKKKPGFTLMEMTIVVALIVIVLAITSSMFITGNKVFSDSNVKSTLQMEARDIQEKLTSIGMQGIGVTDIKIGEYNHSDNGKPYVETKYSELDTKAINYIKIKGYDKDSEYSKNEAGSYTMPDLKEYNINVNNKTLFVNSKPLSTHIKSFSVALQDIENNFENASSMEFDIVLHMEKGVIKADYPINVKVTFRNKGN